MSCNSIYTMIYNEYDGIRHDYTRKCGLVWEHVFLPLMAPAEWSDRATIWNAVEAAEKTKDSRLAREFIVALPAELDKAAWTEILTGFITENFVADGMCADVSIHQPKGRDHDNPHAHILLTVRPLDEKGAWQYKTEKEYLCVRNGEERGFTAAEFKTTQAEGWEKQYQYKAGRKKEYTDLTREIKEKVAERKTLKRELAALPVLSVFKRGELKKRIAQLSEEIGELEFSKNGIVSGFGKESDKEMPAVPKEIKAARANVSRLDGPEARCTGEIEQSGQEFDRLKDKAKQYDLYNLTDARLALRPQLEDEAKERIRKEIPDRKLNTWDYLLSAQETDRQLGEDGMERWLAEQKRRRRMEQTQRERGERDEWQRKPKH